MIQIDKDELTRYDNLWINIIVDTARALFFKIFYI